MAKADSSRSKMESGAPHPFQKWIDVGTALSRRIFEHAGEFFFQQSQDLALQVHRNFVEKRMLVRQHIQFSQTNIGVPTPNVRFADIVFRDFRQNIQCGLQRFLRTAIRIDKGYRQFVIS